MKKILFIFAFFAAISCGTQKKASQNVSSQEESIGVKIQKSPAQIFAEDASADNLRAWASYNGFENQNLEVYAAASARAKMAEEIATLIKSAVYVYENGNRIDNTDINNSAENIKLAESVSESKIKSVSEELITGSRIAVSDRYRQKDRTVTCYIAVEMNLKGVLDRIKADTKLQESISQARRAEIDFRSEKFDEAFKSSFEDLKAVKSK